MEITAQAQLELGIRLVIAVLLGGLIGIERERHGHAAGLGTFAMVTLGACVFSMVSDLVFAAASDNTRIASGVVEGIGFLGAGIIIHGRSGGGVMGLTTAAALWASAAVGMLVGYGLFVLAVITAIAVLLILVIRHVPPVARTIEELRDDDDHDDHGA